MTDDAFVKGPTVELRDEHFEAPVVEESVVFHGGVWDVRTEAVDLGSAGVVHRDFIAHPGAVGVVALDGDRVLLVRQYRHPVRSILWEIPAGLCDVTDEPFEETARRELWEETGHEASELEPLLDTFLSPGSSSERLVLFLARDAHLSERERPLGSGEERDMQVAWWPRSEVLAGVLAGRLRNPSLVLGILALAAREGS